MEANDCFEILRTYALSLVGENADWESLALKIEIQPLMVGMSGKGKLMNGDSFPLKTKFPSDIKNSILELHQNTIGKSGENKWNRLKLSFNKNGAFETIYEWDTIWQAEVDGFNKEAEQEDSNYKAPKWFWEMDEEKLT